MYVYLPRVLEEKNIWMKVKAGLTFSFPHKTRIIIIKVMRVANHPYQIAEKRRTLGKKTLTGHHHT